MRHGTGTMGDAAKSTRGASCHQRALFHPHRETNRPLSNVVLWDVSGAAVPDGFGFLSVYLHTISIDLQSTLRARRPKAPNQ